MNNRMRRMLIVLLLYFADLPPGASDLLIQQLISLIYLLAIPPLDPVLPLRHRLYPFAVSTWRGRDVYSLFAEHPPELFGITGESIETFLDMHRTLHDDLVSQSSRNPYMLSTHNRLLLILYWLRQYPTIDLLSLLFDISPSTVSRELRKLWPILRRHYSPMIRWPEHQEWISMKHTWPELPGVVGAIDGTSHTIYRPKNNQAHYYSGHRHAHCIHTQVIIDNHKRIVHVASGFAGHNNDAQCFNLMENIGPNMELSFPSGECCLLADKIYPATPPILKPYTAPQLARAPRERKVKMRKLNRKISARRVYIEHVIGHLKCYRVISSLYTYRHRRRYTSAIVELCAGLAVRAADQF